MKIFMCISTRRDHEPKLIQNLRLRVCKILIAFPQAELSILDRIPARWECRIFFLRFRLLVWYRILNSRERNIGLMVCVARGSKASLRSI